MVQIVSHMLNSSFYTPNRQPLFTLPEATLEELYTISAHVFIYNRKAMFIKAVRAIVLISMCFGAIAALAGDVAERGCRNRGSGKGCIRDVADTAASLAL
ncbi:hypothetical protein PILCRDRAFT_179099 [Piloderma croceum F 1598]|uniref:Uncharacterized protein n=1 Tax=Piloderma croceum (strain F 1598) TaxID=765440 RepID=A0A0C3GI24_PILCF|nr:hypothetical protein PILCRDRAFT_179099 [Piloderma croceum F 1598]